MGVGCTVTLPALDDTDGVAVVIFEKREPFHDPRVEPAAHVAEHLAHDMPAFLEPG